MTTRSQRDPKAAPAPTVGVLALQGDYDAHARMVASLGAAVRLVRSPEDLSGGNEQPPLDGLILPGGESTAMLRALERGDFFSTLQSFVRTTPTFGTCAGCILLATRVANPLQQSLAALDVTVERNAYGRQNDSSIVTAETEIPGGPLEMVFIRAPRLAGLGPDVETLATWKGDAVLVRAGHILAATFHPELSGDSRVHALFLQMLG